MKRAFHFALVGVLAAETLLVAQNSEVTRILGAVREALGGDEQLAAVENVSVEGTSTRPGPDGTSRASAFEMAIALPDKFMTKSVLANFNGMEISRSTGFNGDGLIEQMDTPPQFGGMVMLRTGAGGAGMELTPEEEAAQQAITLTSNRQEFARLALGMFGSTFSAYPLEFTYVGEAESPDGKADVLDATGADDFAVRFFIDQETHLPLMLSWMDEEPLQITAGGGPQVMTMGGGGRHGGSGGQMSSTDPEQLREEMEKRLEEAEANRRVVEYRLFYADYKAFDGVRFPTRIQRMVDGQAAEELELDRVTVNGTIDPKTFETVKSAGR
jgi:hypothetical protein